MRLSDTEYTILQQAVTLIKSRRRKSPDMAKAYCAVVNVEEMYSKNKQLTQYHRNQMIVAIVIPLAMMFFLSHSVYNNPNIVEDLATYIEDHSFNITPL